MSGSCAVFAIAAALAPHSTVRDEVADFRAALAQVQQLVQHGSFDRAERQLREMLDAHAGADYARLQRSELVEIARRCAFKRHYAEPRLDDLVSGQLVRYEAKSGDLEIRYRSDALQDFKRTQYLAEGDDPSRIVFVHPAVFAGPFTIELECHPTRKGGLRTRIVFGIDTAEELVVHFGTCPEEPHEEYWPPQIYRAGSAEAVEKQSKPAEPFDQPYSLKVVVQAGSVTAFRDGKRILQAKRTSREFGRFSLVNPGRFDRMTIKGKVQGSWLQGRLDAARQEALDAFDRRWKPESELPSWLFEGDTAAAKPSDADDPAEARTNFVVKSDIDSQICVDAAKALEESYRSYRHRLAPVPDEAKPKFAVYVFSGQAGYKDYVRDVDLESFVGAYGVYSHLLKQVLIWNLPDRRLMLRTARHLGFHQYLDRLGARPPYWYRKGLAEYYELADVYGGEWKEGQLNPDHVETLTANASKWVPLSTLLELDVEKFDADSTRHEAQSWAVVHYLRQGPKGAQETFKRMWSATLAGKGGDDWVEEAFRGIDLGTFEAELRKYVLAMGC